MRGKVGDHKDRPYARLGLRNNIGRQLVRNEADAILDEQFAFFETLNLQQIGARRVFECRDSGIEVAVLLQELRQLLSQIAFFFFGHRYR
jgi:hypothetical protein